MKEIVINEKISYGLVDEEEKKTHSLFAAFMTGEKIIAGSSSILMRGKLVT